MKESLKLQLLETIFLLMEDMLIFSNSLEEDALRRDFTINAMYLDKGGNFRP